MTAIAAIAWPQGALMAADAAVTEDSLVIRERSPKVAHRSGYLVGASGNTSLCNAVLSAIDLDYRTDATLLSWVLSDYVPALRSRVETLPDMEGWEVLLAAPGELVSIDDEFGCHDHHDAYAAIGSGARVALGALAATPMSPPLERARIALRVASYHTTTVDLPWSYVHTDGSHGRL